MDFEPVTLADIGYEATDHLLALLRSKLLSSVPGKLEREGLVIRLLWPCNLVRLRFGLTRNSCLQTAVRWK